MNKIEFCKLINKHQWLSVEQVNALFPNLSHPDINWTFSNAFKLGLINKSDITINRYYLYTLSKKGKNLLNDKTKHLSAFNFGEYKHNLEVCKAIQRTFQQQNKVVDLEQYWTEKEMRKILFTSTFKGKGVVPDFAIDKIWFEIELSKSGYAIYEKYLNDLVKYDLEFDYLVVICNEQNFRIWNNLLYSKTWKGKQNCKKIIERIKIVSFEEFYKEDIVVELLKKELIRDDEEVKVLGEYHD